MTRPPLAVPLALSVTALALAAAGATAQDDTPSSFTETIEVREVEVFFDASPLPRFEAIGKKGIGDFAAFEGGKVHDLIEMAPTSSADWVHVLWFDDALAGRAAQAAAANALAQRADVLAAGGRAEVVIADPRPRIVTATATPDLLRRALGEIAARPVDPNGGREAPPPASIAERARQLDRLVVDLAARGGGGARALWLAVDGWPLSPRELEKWTRSGEGDEPELPARRAIAETARALGGYGWVTYPVAIRSERELASPQEKEKGISVSTGGTGDERTTVPIFSAGGGTTKADPSAEAQLDTLTNFALAPVNDLARVTSGSVIGHPDRLRTELAELVSRRRATFRAPRPGSGSLQPFEIRWRGGDGRPLPSTRFLRSSTPPEVTAARLRALLAGDSAPASVSVAAGEPAREVCFTSDMEELPVRISLARENADGSVSVALGEVKPVAREGGRRCQPLPPGPAEGAVRLAWVAENLDDESWTGGVVTPAGN